MEGLRPVRFYLYLDRSESSVGNLKEWRETSLLHSGVYTNSHVYSDLTDFSDKKSVDANTSLILYSFHASKIIYMYNAGL